MPQLSRRTKFVIATGVGVVLLVGGLQAPVAMPEIVLAAEKVTSVAGFSITNTLIATWLTMITLLVLSFAATRKLQLVPTGLQNFFEAILEAILGIIEGVAGKEKSRSFFPLVATIFLFVLFANWIGLLPGFSTIGIITEPEPGKHAVTYETINVAGIRLAFTPIGKKVEAQAIETDHAVASPGKEGNASGVTGVFVPILRSANSGLNTTMALALIAMVFVEYFGVKSLGVRTYGSKFINIGKLMKGQIVSGLLDLFVGILETISELARLISFTFRLFGNVFAGEVLLAVITFLVPWIAALPFLGLELFVGFIQAFVFAMLTLVFLSMATMHPHGEAAHSHHGA
ncbi:MAG: F0F1 ATP synthase subunit A [Dehalococcoidia bacterium]|nr:F0F1 ATP synthase subunit A [Dehalococcoidia bacterium]